MQRITRRSFLGGAPAMALGTHPWSEFASPPVLALDAIHVYRLDASTATLTPHDSPLWRARTGYGPRALQFHPNGRVAYCVNELKPTVNVLGWDDERGY
jgi:6-phosphogluconolactonase (cycloisomerase 2 family)